MSSKLPSLTTLPLHKGSADIGVPPSGFERSKLLRASQVLRFLLRTFLPHLLDTNHSTHYLLRQLAHHLGVRDLHINPNTNWVWIAVERLWEEARTHAVIPVLEFTYDPVSGAHEIFTTHDTAFTNVEIEAVPFVSCKTT